MLARAQQAFRRQRLPSTFDVCIRSLLMRHQVFRSAAGHQLLLDTANEVLDERLIKKARTNQRHHHLQNQHKDGQRAGTVADRVEFVSLDLDRETRGNDHAEVADLGACGVYRRCLASEADGVVDVDVL